MDATTKEKQLVNSVLKLKLSLALVVGMFIMFVFAKVEYRTVVFTDVSSHAFGTSYQGTFPAKSTIVNFSIGINSSLTLSGGQTGTVVLQTSPDNTTWSTVCTVVNGNTGSLTLGLNTLNSQTVQMIAAVPVGYYYKLVTSGASTFSVVNGRECAF